MTPQPSPASAQAETIAQGLCTFMERTQQLTREQLAIYDDAAFLSPAGRKYFEQNIEECIGENLEIARAAIGAINKLGFRVYATHVGRTGLIGALDYSETSRSYSIGVHWPDSLDRGNLPFSPNLRLHI